MLERNGTPNIAFFSTVSWKKLRSASLVLSAVGVPALLVIASGVAYGESLISLSARGVLWITAVAWAGTGCLMNARSCGRLHCRIDGILFPLLAVVGALNVLSIISFDWNLFWLAFLVILVASFVPEWTWKKYSRPRRTMQ